MAIHNHSGNFMKHIIYKFFFLLPVLLSQKLTQKIKLSLKIGNDNFHKVNDDHD